MMRRKINLLKKIIVILLSTILVAGTIPLDTFANELTISNTQIEENPTEKAEEYISEEDISVENSVEEHIHDENKYIAWTSTDSLPTSGNYYLTDNVTLSIQSTSS